MNYLKIQNFESHIEQRFLDRGFTIYEQDYLEKVEPIGVGKFFAAIFGTMGRYKLYTEIDEDGYIEDHHCTCPFDGYICKHLVALFYYLRDSEMWKDLPQNTVLDRIEHILDNTSQDRLKSFILEKLKKDDEFREEFMDFFER